MLKIICALVLSVALCGVTYADKPNNPHNHHYYHHHRWAPYPVYPYPYPYGYYTPPHYYPPHIIPAPRPYFRGFEYRDENFGFRFGFTP